MGLISDLLIDAAGRPIARMDANGRLSTTIYDGLAKPSVQLVLPGISNFFTFDSIGQTVAITNARGNTTTTSSLTLKRRSKRIR